MENKNNLLKIIESIRNQDCQALESLLKENPEQISAYTLMAGQTWLGYAAQLGKLEAIRTLVKVGCEINQGDKHDGAAPLDSAAANGHYDVVEYLLQAGARLDTTLPVRNPLFAAIIGRSPGIVRLLLEAGIDSTVRYNSATMKDMDAVAFALMRGEQECARIIALWNAKGDEQIATAKLAEADEIAERNAH